jgi:hypothetical protein
MREALLNWLLYPVVSHSCVSSVYLLLKSLESSQAHSKANKTFPKWKTKAWQYVVNEKEEQNIENIIFRFLLQKTKKPKKSKIMREEHKLSKLLMTHRWSINTQKAARESESNYHNPPRRCEESNRKWEMIKQCQFQLSIDEQNGWICVSLCLPSLFVCFIQKTEWRRIKKC